MKNLSLSVVATAVALLLAEILLRVLDVARPPELPPSPSRPDLYIADSTVGYRLWPSTRTCVRYPANSHRVQHVVSNSDGFFSSRELGEPDPRPRVLVLGDSFTFGFGINEGERFTEVVEELEPRWRVESLAMPGWGIDLMVRALEKYGPKAHPNVVVLAFYTDDFTRLHPRYAGLGYATTKFALQDGKLVNVAYPRKTLWRRLRLVELVRSIVERRKGSYFELNEALVDRFQSLAGQLGASPVILFLPGRNDTDTDRERRAKLRRWAETRQIAFRDLTEPILGRGAAATYLPDNWHWNEHGHRIAGEALHSLLVTDVLRDAGAEIDLGALPPTPWRSGKLRYCSDEARSE